MSLDVYLTTGEQHESGSGIFIREGGQMRQISRAEWDEKFPGKEPVVLRSDDGEAYSANITHNLNAMASEAGIYRELWRPDENDITHARQLIEPLTVGLGVLRADPERFKKLNPKNGWGDYEGLIAFVENYLTACKAFPDAKVSVWR